MTRSTPRPDGRKPAELREVSIETGVARHAEGSALISLGHTKVLCAASVEERVPAFLKGTRKRLGHGRVRHAPPRHAHALGARGGAGQAGRPHARDPAPDRPVAAQRHRAARPRRAHDHARLRRPPGRRRHALRRDHGGVRRARDGARASSRATEKIPRWPLRETVAAVSVGICAGQAVLDLAYEEDSEADVDCNVVGTASGPSSRSRARPSGGRSRRSS